MENSEEKLQELMEYHYILGQRSAFVSQLHNILNELSVPYTDIDDAPENLMTIARLTVEREDTISALRGICEDHGDNEWDNNSHLADVVDKHLGKYL
jgi:predicted secreted protein